MGRIAETSSPADFAGSGAEASAAIVRVTATGLLINLALSAFKMAAGLLGASQAVLADGVHSLSDSLTDIAILVGARYWNRPADAAHPHGHRRIETIVTLFIGVALAGAGGALAYDALLRLGRPAGGTPGWIAFVAAALSIPTKEGLFRWTRAWGRRIKSSALTANAWHHRSDGLSSLPAALAVLAARLVPEWTFLDPLATVVVAVFIVQAAWEVGRPAFAELTDAAVSAERLERIWRVAKGVSGVEAVHAVRTRRLGGGVAVDLHVLVDGGLSVYTGHAISERVRDALLESGPDVVDAVVHLEPFEGESGSRTAHWEEDAGRDAPEESQA